MTWENTWFNPNKAGLFEGCLSWGGGQFDSPFIFQEETYLISI